MNQSNIDFKKQIELYIQSLDLKEITKKSYDDILQKFQ